jgi:glycosyltransferase involved in cell wall biosynthesis
LPVAFFLARRHHARFIIEVRDLWPLSLQELAGLPPWHPLVLLMAACESFAYRNCDYAVSVLPSAESHMRSRGLARGKFRHIPNGVNAGPTTARPTTLESVAKAAAPVGGFVVGFVGTFSEANFLIPLIEAARLLQRHAEVRFVLCGRGPLGEELRRLSKGLTNVTFLDTVARGKVLDVVETFDLCYVGFRPSPLYRYGISPNKLYDYMFAARPVLLAANVPSSEVERARCGFVIRSADPQSIAQAVLSMSHRAPGDLRSMGERGRAFVLRYHDYDVLASRYLELL